MEDAEDMRRSTIIAIAALILGAAVLSYTLNDSGPKLSFPLLLGALLVADGVIRLMLMRFRDAPSEPEREPAPAVEA